MSKKQSVIVDLGEVSDVTEDTVSVEIVSDRYDDPYEAKYEMKKRKNNIYGSSRGLHVVAIPNDEA